MILQFELTNVVRNSSRLDPVRLDELNGLELNKQINDPQQINELVRKVHELAKQRYPKDIQKLDLTDDHIKRILKLGGGRLSYLEDLFNVNHSFLWVLPSDINVKIPENWNTERLVETLESIDEFDVKQVATTLREFCKKNDVKFKNLMQTMRALLSGLPDGPTVPEMSEMLGKKTTIERIRRFDSIAKTKTQKMKQTK